MKRRSDNPYIIGFIITGTCGAFVALIALFGYLAPRDFHERLTINVPAPLPDVWNELTDLESLPHRRSDVESVEVIGTSEQGYRQWKEYARGSSYRLAETIDEVSQEKIVNAATSSRSGLEGVWTYTVTALSASSTELSIEETSTVPGMFSRAWLTLLGRDRFLKREIASFQKQ